MTEVDPSPALLPWPPQWARPQLVKYTFIALFLALFGCVGIAAGVSVFLPGFEDSRAYLLVVAAPLLFGVAGIVTITRLRLRSRPAAAVHSGHVDEVGEDGLVIPYSRPLGAVYVVVMAVTLLGFVIIAVVTVVALIEAADWGLVMQAVVMVGFAGYLAWFVTEVVRRRLVRGAVTLTRHGIYHRSWAFDSFLRWDQVVSVSAGRMDGQFITVASDDNAQPQVRRRSRFWQQPEYKLLPHTAVSGRYLSIDPALAFHALRFYATTPAARAELGTETAVQRVRAGRVLTPDLKWV
jgi:hypothetical protein